MESLLAAVRSLGLGPQLAGWTIPDAYWTGWQVPLGDAFHHFPSSFDGHIIESGAIGKLSSQYIQYEVTGFVNGVAGTYQIGGTWVNGVFQITHRFFRPF